MNYQDRLLKVIPGGAHTYSRGYDQYPANAPQILIRGKGSNIYDPDGKKYLDYGMALRAVNIGYAEAEIDSAAILQIKNGNNLTRPSLIELEAAELLVELIDSVDMVNNFTLHQVATEILLGNQHLFRNRPAHIRMRMTG